MPRTLLWRLAALALPLLTGVLGALDGPEAFRAGMDLYFERWDGHATTVEEFIRCFAEASDKDLTHFFAWYEQAGTPRVGLKQTYDAQAQTLTLELSQRTPPTPGQGQKRPLPIPVVVGLNWRRATRAGAIAWMLGGMVTCLVWSRLGSPYFLGLDPAEAGVVVSAALMFTVSLMTSPASPPTLRQFFVDRAATSAATQTAHPEAC